MAKCIGSVSKWTAKEFELKDTNFLVDNVRVGEGLLKERVERMAESLMDIANHYNMIRNSALYENFQMNCTQVQDGLLSRLETFLNEATSVIGCISRSTVISSTKHRYFIQFTYGLIEKLERLVQSIGRLGDADQRLYMGDFRSMLVSDESIALHSLVSIWTAIIELLDTICRSAQPVFNPNPDEPDEYDFLDQLEFSTARNNFSRALLMDLTITSWIKFNMLVKYDDLVTAQPLLCQCQMQVFLRLISFLAINLKPVEGQPETESPVLNPLRDMLMCILDYTSKPSLMSISVHRFAIIPLEPCYASARKQDLAYFVVWHLYSMARAVRNPAVKQMVAACRNIFDDSAKVARESFETSNGALSPHQKERLQLLEYMTKSWEAFIFSNEPTTSEQATA